MKLNFLVLGIPSLVQLYFVLRHLFKYRPRAVAISFVVFGLIFGIFRSNVIHLVQVSLNNSFVPYEFNNSLLKIGNDSLQVYIGWIITGYLAWCFAEIIVKRLSRALDYKNLENNLLAILSVGFIFIMAFSYMIETAASYMGWWDWNALLEAGFSQSLFVNVPWVGIIDWGTVAFEFLGVFLVGWHVYKNKQYKYLLILLFPLLHWISHLRFEEYLQIGSQNLSVASVFHLLIPVFAVSIFYIKSPISKVKVEIPYRLVWIALLISYVVCLGSTVFAGQKLVGLLSLIPITLLMMLAANWQFIKIFYISGAILFTSFIAVVDPLDRKRIVIAFFPLVFLAIIYILRYFPGKKIWQKYQTLILGIMGLLVISILAFTLSLSQKDASLDVANIPDSKKYVLLITIDTLRDDHTGVGGYKLSTTTNLDTLAKEGVYFSDAYTTIPLTTPAHISLLTGKYPNTLGITKNSNTTNFSDVTLAELFKARGYNTAAFISTNRLDRDGLKKGFDSYDYQTNVTEKYRERRADDTNKLAYAWLEQNYQEPFFVWLHYYDIHSPYDTYCPKSYSQGKSAQTSQFKDGLLGTNFNIIPKVQDYDFLMARYDEEVKCTDQQMGELFNKLKKLGIYDDVNIVVLSDHGENFDHNTFYHGRNLYESGLQIPLVVKIKDFNDLNKNNRVLLTDIFPTLIDKFGLTPSASDGIGLESYDLSSREDVYFETQFTPLQGAGSESMAGVLREKNKLVVDLEGENLDKFDNFRVFNIFSDPDELNNIWDSTSQEHTSLKQSLIHFLNN